MNQVLHNAVARLEPLRIEHAQALWEAKPNPELWRFMPYPAPPSVDALAAWIDMRLTTAGEHDVVYIVRDAEGTVAGSTSLFAHDPSHKKAEIGHTWVGQRWHGTALNKACKHLLLQHAFGKLALNRVQLKCDARNRHSFHAMASLGAVHEGTLRQHDVLWDGFVRDVEMFSITAADWPAIDERLRARLGSRGP